MDRFIFWMGWLYLVINPWAGRLLGENPADVVEGYLAAIGLMVAAIGFKVFRRTGQGGGE